MFSTSATWHEHHKFHMYLLCLPPFSWAFAIPKVLVTHTHTHIYIYIYIHICKFVPVFKDVRTVQSLSYRSVGFSPTLPALVAVGRRKEEQNQEEVSKSELQ